MDVGPVTDFATNSETMPSIFRGCGKMRAYPWTHLQSICIKGRTFVRWVSSDEVVSTKVNGGIRNPAFIQRDVQPGLGQVLVRGVFTGVRMVFDWSALVGQIFRCPYVRSVTIKGRRRTIICLDPTPTWTTYETRTQD